MIEMSLIKTVTEKKNYIISILFYIYIYIALVQILVHIAIF